MDIDLEALEGGSRDPAKKRVHDAVVHDAADAGAGTTVAPLVFDYFLTQTFIDIIDNATIIDTTDNALVKNYDAIDAMTECCAADPALSWRHVSDTNIIGNANQQRVAVTRQHEEPDVALPQPPNPRYRPSTTSMTESELDEAALRSTEAAEAVAREKARRGAQGSASRSADLQQDDRQCHHHRQCQHYRQCQPAARRGDTTV